MVTTDNDHQENKNNDGLMIIFFHDDHELEGLYIPTIFQVYSSVIFSIRALYWNSEEERGGVIIV